MLCVRAEGFPPVLVEDTDIHVFKHVEVNMFPSAKYSLVLQLTSGVARMLQRYFELEEVKNDDVITFLVLPFPQLFLAFACCRKKMVWKMIMKHGLVVPYRPGIWGTCTIRSSTHHMINSNNTHAIQKRKGRKMMKREEKKKKRVHLT